MYCLVSYSSSYKQSVEELRRQLVKNAILSAAWSSTPAGSSCTAKQRQDTRAGEEQTFSLPAAKLTGVLGTPAADARGKARAGFRSFLYLSL